MPNPQPPRRHRMLAMALLFELSLGLIGLVIAWAGRLPLHDIWWPQQMMRALGVGMAAGLLMMPLLSYLLNSLWSPIVELRDLVTPLIREWLAGSGAAKLLALSLSAGVGEEILFRGAIQPLAIEWTNPLTGIVITSLLFGAVHAATPTYFVLATLIGVYFGSLSYWQHEIVSAMIAHALYDFVALRAILRR